MFTHYISFIKEYPLVIAPLIGFVPALFWLWFWLKEDVHPEPVKMITLSFLGGVVAVILVLPLQQIILDYAGNQKFLSFFLWASLEESFKFLMVYFIALKRNVNDEPVDNIIYMIVSALGFVALENTFFLTDLIRNGDFLGVFITNNMRFIGASLLHIMASATIGICMALSFYKSKREKIIYTLIGVVIAIILHTSFNIYIMNVTDGNIFAIFGAVWVGIIALLLLFEKVKKINPSI